MAAWKICAICKLSAPDVADVGGVVRCPTADRCRRVLEGVSLSDVSKPVEKIDFDSLPDPPRSFPRDTHTVNGNAAKALEALPPQ